MTFNPIQLQVLRCCCGLHSCSTIVPSPPETPPHQVFHKLEKEVLGLGLQSVVLGLEKIVHMLLLSCRRRKEPMCTWSSHRKATAIRNNWIYFCLARSISKCYFKSTKKEGKKKNEIGEETKLLPRNTKTICLYKNISGTFFI